MSNQWLRLWHDMPNDPKWRTVARIANQPISLVLSVYLHLLVDASRNVTRGHATVTHEDLASALDVTEEVIKAILAAMQGRVLDGIRLSGWELRQPKREDSGDESTGAKSAAQRKREQRERARLQGSEPADQQCHDESRSVTLDKEEDKEEDKEKDKDKKTEKKEPKPAARVSSLSVSDLKKFGVASQTANEFLSIRKSKRAPLTELAMAGIRREADIAGLSVDNALRKCIERGWQSFDASWVQSRAGPAHPGMNKQEALEASNQAVVERMLRNSL
jgi:hypothetical protein